MATQVIDQLDATAHQHDEKTNVTFGDGSIRFWTSREGQTLIESFGTWKGSTALSCSLAQGFPELYGSEAGLNNLWGQNNSAVAAFVLSIESLHDAESVECRTLARALDTYARVELGDA